jgi:hypothetical protein
MITVIKLICVLYAALGGALDFTSTDKRFLTDKYINNYMQEIEAKVDEKQQNINLVDEIFDKRTSENRKKRVQEEIDLIKDPIVQMYRQQRELSLIIDESKTILKDEKNVQGSIKRNRAFHDGRDAIKKIDNLREAMKAHGASFDGNKNQNQSPGITSPMQTYANYDLAGNITPPIFKEERYYREAVDYLRDPQNSPISFINKYFTTRYGEAYTRQVLELIENTEIEHLPIGDKAHILQAKLKNEFANSLIPSLLASAFIPLFLEIMSLLTLIAVFNAPRYKMLYSNRDFQDKIESLTCVLIHYMQVKYQQILDEDLLEDDAFKDKQFIFSDKVIRPLVYETLWEQVISQRIREGKSPSIESLISEYTQQFYKLDKFKKQIGNAQDREN